MTFRRTTRTTLRAAAGVLAVGLALTACSGGTDEAGDDTAGTVTLGFLPSWTDGLSTAYLWQAVLEDSGYDVEMTELSEPAPLFAGVAGGDVDVFPSAWPQVTHADYMAEYGDDLEDLGAWYDGAVLTLAVPEYTDVDSIADLNAAADRFDGRILGIEPGAGLTGVVQDSVIPAYGLDLELVTSSTAAMLAELATATENQEDVVVTLWRPFWANTAFPMKDLADPEGALGQAETLNTIAHAGFSEEFPEVAEMMADFTLTDEQYGSLEDTVVNEYGEGRYAEGVDAWLEANPDFLATLTS